MKGGNSQPSMKTRIVESALCNRRPANAGAAGAGEGAAIDVSESVSQKRSVQCQANVPARGRVRGQMKRTIGPTVRVGRGDGCRVARAVGPCTSRPQTLRCSCSGKTTGDP